MRETQLTNEIMLSASIIDLGFIKWSQNAFSFASEGDLVFEGVGNAEEYLWYNMEDIKIGDYVDTLVNNITFSDEQGSYKTRLPTKVYIGGTYQLNKRVNFGLMTRTDFYNSKMHPSLTVSANLNPTKWISTSFTYSMFPGSPVNVGAGIAFKAGPAQIYLISDNIPIAYAPLEKDGPAVLPYKAKGASLRFGISLLFGCKKKVDYPSIMDLNYF